MNIDPKSELAKGFVTTVGIVSSRGKNGNNLMAAEWTYLVSYSPAIITIHIGNHKSKATAENITETGVFGVSLAATHQNVITSIIGNHTGYETNKIAALEDLGYHFDIAKTTGVLLAKDAVFLAECKLVKIEAIGDHTMFVGEVVAMEEGTSNDPILYNKKRYWKVGSEVVKPSGEDRERFKEVVARHQK